MKNEFVLLFKKYGFSIMPWKDDISGSSFVAYNNTFCIPCTMFRCASVIRPFILFAVSFRREDMGDIMEFYKKGGLANSNKPIEFIGIAATTDLHSNGFPFPPLIGMAGWIDQTNLDLHKLEQWLENTVRVRIPA